MTNLFTYYSQILFLSLIIVNHLFEIYLSRRQLIALQQNASRVPAEFNTVIGLSDHQKSISYASAKLNLSQLQLVWDAILMFYWFPFRGAEKLYLLLPEVGIHKEVLFLMFFGFIQYVLNLHWSIYSTFILEERFGFNKTTPALFIKDRLKGLLLSALLGLPLLYAMIALFNLLESWWWLASFIIVTIFQFFLIWIYPKFIAPLFNKFHPLEQQELKEGIEKLVLNAGFEAKEIFIMDASRRSSHGNAYFTGLGKNKRVVFFDTLLKDLQNKEILAILAHELGHMKLKHIPKSMALSIVLSFFGFWVMGMMANQIWFFNGHFIRIMSPAVLFLLFSQAIPVYNFWFSPISSWLSRKREFEADQYASKETNSEDLISGLLKLYQQNSSPVITDKMYSTFYYSHPPALERIKALRSFETKTS
jgi:STE24 endopeptidase